MREIADNIYEYNEELLQDEDSNISKVRKAIREYGRGWLKQHYKWLQSKLFRQLQTVTLPVPLADTPEVTITEPGDMPVVDDDDSVINPIKQWKIAYTTSVHNPEGSNLIDLSSNNPQELLEKLEAFIRSQKMASTVKTSSIVNCLEQIISTPSEIEMFTPHLGEHYSDMDYKKRKRGGMRILYRLDPETKTLVFWLHKKQQFTYKLH